MVPRCAHLDNLHALYRHKFKTRRFAAIITSDTAAFQFVLNRRDELFPDVPVVFCGVNGFISDMIAHQKKITGVAELADFRSTLLLIPRMLPHTREIVVISADSIGAREDRKLVEAAIPALGGRIQVTFWQGIDIEEAMERAARLPADTAILSYDVITSRTGYVVSNLEKIRRLSRAAPVPIFVVREEDLGSGALGGRLVSGFEQGRQAAVLTLDILGDRDADDIPVLIEGANPYMFDFNMMERFGIPEASLPPGSVIINRPETTYQRYRAFMVVAAVVVLVLASFIATLVFNILRRQAAEQALRDSEEGCGPHREFADRDLPQECPGPLSHRQRTVPPALQPGPQPIIGKAARTSCQRTPPIKAWPSTSRSTPCACRYTGRKRSSTPTAAGATISPRTFPPSTSTEKSTAWVSSAPTSPRPNRRPKRRGACRWNWPTCRA